MHSPARRVHEVPELVGLICGFVEKKNLVKLLTVSRCLFYHAAPLVWKEVTGVENLFSILPGLGFDFEELLRVGSCRIPPCSQDELARFAIYASFIQRLESDTENDEGSLCFDLLLSRVPTRPLLPNLRALVINPRCLEEQDLRIVEYVDTFLCPTLSCIYTTQGYNIWINPLEARDLMMRMVTTCPNLTKLSILPGNSRHPIHLLELGPHSPSSIFTPLGQFLNLRFLHSSSAVLHPGVLQLLGKLPLLESLSAYSHTTGRFFGGDDEVEADEIPINDLTLPEDAFPSLRNLGVDCPSGTVVSKLWQTPPLVRNLVSIRIQFMHDNDAEALSELVCIVCQGSPHVTDLSLDLVQSEGTEFSSAVPEHISRLPLLRLQLWDCDLDVQPLTCSLPNLEYLNIEWVHLDFEELTLIAKHMPKLQYLHVGLLFSSWPEEPDLPRDAWSPSPCYIDSGFPFEEEFGNDTDDPDFQEAVMDIARGLHALWPRGVHCAFGRTDICEHGESDPATLKHLNEMIRALCGTSVVDVPTHEESLSRWLYTSR